MNSVEGLAEIGSEADAQSVELAAAGSKRAPVDLQTARIARVIASDNFEEQCGVGNGAGDRPGMRQRRP